MKLWGGRFTKNSDSFTDHFHSSISFDQRMAQEDILGSIAHAQMLGAQNIISIEDAETIEIALKQILDEVQQGSIHWDETAEDIHMNVETLLIQRIGDVGKRLHTGRSRNDQVALDIRMILKKELFEIDALLFTLQKTLHQLAQQNMETILPGYTHLQRAQPVSLAHHFLAYLEMLKRDRQRLFETYCHTDCMPLGSGALAGTPYPLDRKMVANTLGFSKITSNSMDGVSDRDFCIDFLSFASVCMMHMSRFCEELVLWSSGEFGFIELDDSYATGSSIMPQKKNPDMAELIRGKTGRVYGHLMGLLTVMKGLPLAYNKDMQEDKECVFDTLDTIKMCLPILTAMLNTMTIRKEAMKKAAMHGFTNATDAADWLVGKGVPFRDAHAVIGRLVLYCVQEQKGLEELSLAEYQSVSPVFDKSVFDAISLEKCLEARRLQGGTSPEAVHIQLEENTAYFDAYPPLEQIKNE